MSAKIVQGESEEIVEKTKIISSPLIQSLSQHSLLRRIYKHRELHEFITYILPVLQDSCLAGGSLRTLIDNKEILNDIDIFFITETEELAHERIIAAKTYFLSYPERYTKIFECPEEKLFTFKDNYSGLKIQLINDAVKTSPESLLNNFDFNACRFAIFNYRFYYSRKSIQDVKSKKLSLFNLIYPVATIKRVYKYMNKGYQVNDCLVSIVSDLNSPDRQFGGEEIRRVYID